MVQNDLITVIIPVYNRESYLTKCIESVLTQKNVNTEIILVDDGSTDNSLQICKDYSKNHPNIAVIHTENHGVSHAKNTALGAATGDYVIFLDSDDCFAPDALEALLSAIKSHDVDYVVGGFELFDEKGAFISRSVFPTHYANKILDNYTYLNMFVDADGRFVEHLTKKLFKMTLWKNLRFREDVRTSEDDFLLESILDSTSNVFILDKIVYQQTLTSDSLTRLAPTLNLICDSESRLVSLDFIISLGNYGAAVFRFGEGTRKLLTAKKHLHSQKEVKEIKNLYKRYCSIAQKLTPHVNLKNKIRFLLFRTNFDLYGFIQELTSH